MIYFWRVKSSYTGYLTSFYECRFVDDQGIEYNCSEQYLIKKKQELFDPENITLSRDILQASSDKQIKKLERMIRNFDENIWAERRYPIMLQGLTYKFSQNSILHQKLLATGDEILVGVLDDKIWGIGLSDEDETYNTPQNQWPGQNLLGKALMEVRSSL